MLKLYQYFVRGEIMTNEERKKEFEKELEKEQMMYDVLCEQGLNMMDEADKSTKSLKKIKKCYKATLILGLICFAIGAPAMFFAVNLAQLIPLFLAFPLVVSSTILQFVYDKKVKNHFELAEKLEKMGKSIILSERLLSDAKSKVMNPEMHLTQSEYEELNKKEKIKNKQKLQEQFANEVIEKFKQDPEFKLEYETKSNETQTDL